jgi:hypothetical protein
MAGPEGQWDSLARVVPLGAHSRARHLVVAVGLDEQVLRRELERLAEGLDLLHVGEERHLEVDRGAADVRVLRLAGEVQDHADLLLCQRVAQRRVVGLHVPLCTKKK